MYHVLHGLIVQCCAFLLKFDILTFCLPLQVEHLLNIFMV